MAKGEVLYGPLKPGQSTRFDIANDPRQGYPVFAAGSLDSANPPWALGNRGAPYRYGNLVVGGNRNLVSTGEIVYPIIHKGAGETGIGTGTAILGGSGGLGFWNVAEHAKYVTITNFPQEYGASELLPAVNGELLTTVTTFTDYGAGHELFNKNGTVGVTNGSTSVKGNATTFTTDTLVGGYGYTPERNKLIVGDVIGIGDAGSRQFYRIVAINAASGAGALTIFPAYQGATADPVNYILLRTGYGSYSRIVSIMDDVTGTIYHYYAGNMQDIAIGRGRVQAVKRTGAFGTQHFMAPRTVDAAGVPVADFAARDIAYYRGFLLYGAGSAVGWSVAGFPTAFPFGPTDFPATNISVIDNTDMFVSFEFLGDQLVALFRRGAWLIQLTGTIPEFNFFRLGEPIGPLLAGTLDPETGQTFNYGRPTCSARNAIYYVSREGLMELTGSVAKCVSDPVGNYTPLRQADSMYCLSWEPTTNSVMWRKAGPTNEFLCYMPDEQSFYPVEIDPQGYVATGITGGQTYQLPSAENYRGYQFAYLKPAGGSIIVHDRDFDVEIAALGDATKGWIWATPILNLSDLYPFFSFGGFRIDARGEAAASPSLTWTIYGGRSPQTMVVRDSGTLLYANGTPDARSLLGGKVDDAFIGIVLTGTKWIELVGVVVYDSSHQARR